MTHSATMSPPSLARSSALVSTVSYCRGVLYTKTSSSLRHSHSAPFLHFALGTFLRDCGVDKFALQMMNSALKMMNFAAVGQGKIYHIGGLSPTGARRYTEPPLDDGTLSYSVTEYPYFHASNFSKVANCNRNAIFPRRFRLEMQR